MSILLALLGVSTALAAACKQSPVPMRYACATSAQGRMRYVAGVGDCRAGERLIDFAARSASPKYACTSVRPRFATLDGGEHRRFLIPAGATWRAAGPEHCRPRRQQRLVLGGQSKVSFCAAVDESGTLRHIGADGHCRRNEIEVFIAAHGRSRGRRPERCPRPEAPPETTTTPTTNTMPPEPSTTTTTPEPPTTTTPEPPNSSPMLTVPAPQSLRENAHLTFSQTEGNAIAVADSDSDGGVERLTLIVAHGTLTPGATAEPLSAIVGDGTNQLTLEDPVAGLNEALDGLVYTPGQSFHGSDSLAIEADDLGHTGSGGPQTARASVALTVEQVDQAPANVVPGQQMVAENGSLSFSELGANEISVEDADSDGYVERVTLGVGHGSLTPGSTGALASVAGSGTGTLVLEGTIVALDEALEGLSYAPAHNYHGPDKVTLETDDLGHTGFGGPLTSTSEVPITVTAVVYDKAVADSFSTGEDETLEVGAPGVLSNDTDSDTPSLALEAKEVTVQPSHGTVTLHDDGSFTYVPDHLYSGTDSFSYVDTDGNTESNEAIVTIEVVGPPVLSGIESGSLSYEAGSPPVAVTSSLEVSDATSTTLSGATVSVSAGLESGDVLGFVNQNGITGSYDAATGLLTLSGTSSLANYQTALRSITFATTDGSSSPGARTLSFQVDDAGASDSASNVVTREVTVTEPPPP